MEFEKYKNKVKYPDTLRKPYLSSQHTCEEAQQYARDFKAYEAQLSKYREEHVKYVQEENRLRELFKRDAFEKLGVQDHPKKEVLWYLAWEDGHSSGLLEVWIYLNRYSELLV